LPAESRKTKSKTVGWIPEHLALGHTLPRDSVDALVDYIY